MKSLLLLCLGWIGCRQMTQAQGLDTSLFECHSFAGQPLTISYKLLKPKDFDPNKRYPLVLFLHGAGERGGDCSLVTKHIEPLFLTPSAREQYPCFVLAPQCPLGKRWVEVDWKLQRHSQPAQPSEPMQTAIQLLDSLERVYPIDTQRIYAVGLSMGGYGVWDALTRYPKRFAAGVPVCGGGDEQRAKQLGQTPVWAFHGAKDNVVPVARSRNMIRAAQKAGNRHTKYTEYPEVKHGSWLPAFQTPELLGWLFGQRLH